MDAAALLALIQSLPAEERARLLAALGGAAAPGMGQGERSDAEADLGPSLPAGGPGPSVEDD